MSDGYIAGQEARCSLVDGSDTGGIEVSGGGCV